MRINDLTLDMKKRILLLLFFIVALNSCERDDICIDDITPKLIIGFFDDEDPDTQKNVNNIEVKIIEIDSIYIDSDNENTIKPATDSIAIPLIVSEGITRFLLTSNSINDTEKNTDTLTVTYNTEDIFVGRSCGYKSIFNNVNYDVADDPDNWIKRLEVVSTRIENKSEDEIRAHVKIFH